MKSVGILLLTLVVAGALYLVLTGGPEGERGRDAGTPGPTADSARRSGRETAAPNPTSAEPERSNAGAGERVREPSVPLDSSPRDATPAGPVLSITGTVLGEAGPLRGARVTLDASNAAASEVLTDRTGRFEAALPFPAEGVVMRVAASEYATVVRELGDHRSQQQLHVGNVFLQRGSTLNGVVVDQAGNAIAGADVFLGSFQTARRSVGDAVRSRADGTFTFEAAPQGNVTLTARASRFAESVLQYRHIPGNTARIELAPGVDLSVLVTREDGTPIPLASVSIRALQIAANPREERTDAEGRARFLGLADTDWNVRVLATGFKPGGIPSVRAASGEATLSLVAWPCATGEIVTADGGPPPAGTLVRAMPSAARGDMIGRLAGGTEVAGDGSFRLCDLRPGEYRVYAFAPGFAPTASNDFRVVDGADVPIGRIVLQAGGGLVLRFQYDGTPVTGVEVEVFRTPPLPAQIWSAPADPLAVRRADARGRLELANMASGQVWLIVRSSERIPRAVGPYAITNGTTNELAAIELPPGYRIVGNVRDPDGRPAERARVTVRGSVTVPFVQTDASGRFTTPPLPYGSYSIEVTSVIDGRLHLASRDGIVISATAQPGVLAFDLEKRQ